MKKNILRIISAVLCLVLIAGIFVPAAMAVDNDHLTDIPLVYIQGQGLPLGIKQDDGTWKNVYPLNISTDYIKSFITKDNIKMFLKCYYTNNYDEFCDVVCDAYLPIFEDYKLNSKAQPDNGSTYITDWHKTLNAKTINGQYPVDRYAFTYDFRLDPYEVADSINEYVNAVCELTGHEKVAILGRCLGANEIFAYLDKYGDEKISDIIIYASALDGCMAISHLFSGGVYVDDDTTVNFVQDYDINKYIGDEILTEFIRAFLVAYNDIGGVKLALNEVNRVYKIVCDNLVPRLLRGSYGSMPGYWAMVDGDNYEKAKKLVFDGVEDEWADFIKIIDNYHYNIYDKQDEILQKCLDDGINFYNIEKYGFGVFPVIKDGSVIADSTVTLTEASKGATTASIYKPFDKKYIAAAEKNGTAKYISPDKQVDASTCILPDQTWFIKNLRHKAFPADANRLVCAMVNSKDTFTVWDDPDLPQFMVFDDETQTIAPMTAENCNTTERWNMSFFEALKVIFKNLSYIFKAIKKLLG